jgi:nitrate reductase gamma subunit
MLAIVAGGLAGGLALVGGGLLLHRRLFDPRIRRSSSIGDILVLVLIWVQLTLGIATTYWTLQHLDGSEMVRFMGWANGILTLNPAAPDIIKETALVYKLHIVLGLTLFVITPFTRLVHIWSAPIWFLLRPGYQIVRSRKLGKPNYSTDRGPAGVAPSYGGSTVLRQMAESGQEGA